MPVDRPNILFFFTDDQRFDTIAALGNPHIRTPNIDRLVGRGTAFTDAYIMGGSCGAVCMPSRAMLHTSRSLYHIEDRGSRIPLDHALLGETLRTAGYDTFGTGKWHNGPDAHARSFSHGGEIFFGGMGDHWNVPACDFDPSGRYESRIQQTTDFHSQAVREWTADHIEAGVHSTELFCDATVDFLTDRARRDSPFFAYVAFMAPHDPRTMPPEYLAMYRPDRVELPPNFLAEHYFDNGELRLRDEVLAAIPRDEGEVRQHIAAYYAMITHLDDHIGRVLGVVEDLGLLEDTIVVFAGDNGLAVGQHGLLGKQNLYEHSVRVPLVFAGPGVPEDQRRQALAGLIDIFPTLCDLADVEVPESVEGESLGLCFDDDGASVRDTMLFAYRHLMRGVRDGAGNKLIETAAAGQCHTQLFHLGRDPWEMRNLAGDPEHAEAVLLMRQALTAWRDDFGDTQQDQGAAFWPQMEWAS
ncbi:MAG: sulfatase-like hydrolase/transferase [Candidatus Latescibacteria bacterium]|nr:sulfatase-like hydrolase/transferase [Candidatus Latescibacterota bacterium]